MRWVLTTIWAALVLGIIGALVVLCGCAKEPPPPAPVPPPPEDLSTWAVPELVQPPAPETPVAEVPKDPKATPAEQVLDFAHGTTFALNVPVGAPLDLVLQHGEQVRNIIGGDRTPQDTEKAARWEIKEGADGIGETMRQHIFITAAAAGMTTGFLVTTTHRTYYLTCKSVKTSPIRTVRWRYPADPVPAKPPKEPGLLPDPAQAKQYHVGYELVGNKPNWTPRQVVDDGKKTYILYPEFTLFDTVPMVRLIGPNGPQLVNARQFLNVVILDQLLPRAELRVGLGDHAEVVTITRANLHTISCPGDASCPVWPHAAQILAQRPALPVPPPPQQQMHVETPPERGQRSLPLPPTPETAPPVRPLVQPPGMVPVPPPEGAQP